MAGLKSLLLNELKGTNTAIECKCEKQWIEVCRIAGVPSHFQWHNREPCISIRNGGALATRDAKKHYETCCYDIVQADDFIAANSGITRMEPEGGQSPMTKFKEGNCYLIREQGKTDFSVLRVSILKITKTCYNYQFEHADRSVWSTIVAFDSTFHLIEDLGPSIKKSP